MKAYKLIYPDGTIEIAVAENIVQIIRRFDLNTKQSPDVKIIELEGEEKAQALKEWKQF